MSGGRLPDFVIIGAMKCGTSTLHEQLALRSGLHMSSPKEPNFFSDEDRYARGLDWYRDCFAGASPGQLCGESSTHYTKWPTLPRAPERLWRHVPEARLVYVMRDPLERIVSQYIHEWSRREVRGRFEEVLLQEERFTAYSSYARQLEPYLERFGSERILLVAFERMWAEPDAQLARICRFIGDPSPEPCRWTEALPAQNVSSRRLRRSPLREALLQVPLLRWLKDGLPSAAREVLKRPWRMVERPEISDALHRELEARIDPDLARLGGWLGRSLSCRDWRCEAQRAELDWVRPPAAARMSAGAGASPAHGGGTPSG